MNVREVFSYLKSNWLTRKDQVNSLAGFISSIIMLVITLMWSFDDALPVTFFSYFVVRDLLLKIYKKKNSEENSYKKIKD